RLIPSPLVVPRKPCPDRRFAGREGNGDALIKIHDLIELQQLARLLLDVSAAATSVTGTPSVLRWLGGPVFAIIPTFHENRFLPQPLTDVASRVGIIDAEKNLRRVAQDRLVLPFRPALLELPE